jgi:hypothetical protein
MARKKGRKRHSSERWPGGKLKPRPKPAPVPPHRRGYGSDPRAATQHGRYFLDGLINGQEWAVGEIHLVARMKYRAAMAAPGALRSRFERPIPRAPHDADDDADIIRRYEYTRKALGKLVTYVDCVLYQDSCTTNVAGYRAGLKVLRRVYGV